MPIEDSRYPHFILSTSGTPREGFQRSALIKTGAVAYQYVNPDSAHQQEVGASLHNSASAGVSDSVYLNSFYLDDGTIARGLFYEIAEAVGILSQWESQGRVPDAWEPTGPFDLRDLCSAPKTLAEEPNRLDAIRTSLTPLFILAALRAFSSHSRGYPATLWRFWRLAEREWGGDGRGARWFYLPPECEISAGELVPIERHSVETVGPDDQSNFPATLIRRAGRIGRTRDDIGPFSGDARTSQLTEEAASIVTITADSHGSHRVEVRS
ncbi:hypothetical protein IAT38_006786 [Cryptococcus sp. DSM 104549]